MKWNIKQPIQYKEIMASKHVSSLVAKFLEFSTIDYDLDFSLNDFSLFNDYQKVLTRINQAIQNKEKICIYGDYDCDGIMATSILVRAFEKKGVKVGYHIPNRFSDGYGLNVDRVKQIASKGYHLIITVDNGVSAIEAVDEANRLGLDVIVTDHHDLPEVLPSAYAIIHTKLSPNYPFKPICGGFVACKLATAMLGYQDPYIYCLAALSTVSDMMPMIDENRTLVKKALRVLNQKKYVSFALLLGENKRFDNNALGFTLAPQINSIGRMDEGLNPNMAVKYFIHEDASSDIERHFKLQFSNAIKEMNLKRKDLTQDQYRLATSEMMDVGGAKVCLSDLFHEGFVGLVAGKISNEMNVPSFIIQKGTSVYKGSCRGIDGMDMHHLLEACGDDLLVYGGHQKAGGFSLEPMKYDSFLNHLKLYLEDHLSDALLSQKKDCIHIDTDDLWLSSVKELNQYEPFGQENEEPVFYLELGKPSQIILMGQGKHLKLQYDLPHCRLEALWFSQGDRLEEIKALEKVHLFGTLSVNQFRNIENISLICKEIR